MDLPDDGPGEQVERIDGVVLRRRQHVAGNDQWRGVNIAVKLGRPRDRWRIERRRGGAKPGASAVAVVWGPFSREGGGGGGARRRSRAGRRNGRCSTAS